MKGITAGIKVGLTAALIVGLGYGSFKFISKGLKGEDGYDVVVRFKDATGLLEKSRVQVAGIVIGEIKGRTLVSRGGEGDEGQALIRLKIKPDVELYSDATIYKKTSSLLGEFYLEIDPGNPSAPDPATHQLVSHYTLRNCKETTGDESCNRIRNVIEPVSVSDVLMQVSETVPVLRDILLDVRKLTQGPLTDITKDVQAEIRREWDNAPTVPPPDDAPIRLTGFPVLLENSGGLAKSILLVPYYGAGIHRPSPPANQMVMVYFKHGLPRNLGQSPIWITGRMYPLAASTAHGRVGYTMPDAKWQKFPVDKYPLPQYIPLR